MRICAKLETHTCIQTSPKSGGSFWLFGRLGDLLFDLVACHMSHIHGKEDKCLHMVGPSI